MPRKSHKGFDDALVLGVFLKLELAAADTEIVFSNKEAGVLDALRRSSSHLTDATPVELGEYVRSLSPEQIQGLASNVKGILHEIEFVNLENADGDSVQASLYEATNHPGYDVRFSDTDTGETWQAQLKATDNSTYVGDWLGKYQEPERLLVTTELAEKLNLGDSGFSNAELTTRTQDVLGVLQGNSAAQIWDFFPLLAVSSLALPAAQLAKKRRLGQISNKQLGNRMALIAGTKVAKMGILVSLLNMPVVNIAVAGYLTHNVLQVGRAAKEAFINQFGPIAGSGSNNTRTPNLRRYNSGSRSLQLSVPIRNNI